MTKQKWETSFNISIPEKQDISAKGKNHGKRGCFLIFVFC